MTEEIDSAKLSHLIGHWIEHNQSHSKSFNEWAAKVKEAGFEEIAEDILSAAEKMDECTQLLTKAKENIK